MPHFLTNYKHEKTTELNGSAILQNRATIFPITSSPNFKPFFYPKWCAPNATYDSAYILLPPNTIARNNYSNNAIIFFLKRKSTIIMLS